MKTITQNIKPHRALVATIRDHLELTDEMPSMAKIADSMTKIAQDFSGTYITTAKALASIRAALADYMQSQEKNTMDEIAAHTEALQSLDTLTPENIVKAKTYAERIGLALTRLENRVQFAAFYH